MTAAQRAEARATVLAIKAADALARWQAASDGTDRAYWDNAALDALHDMVAVVRADHDRRQFRRPVVA